MAAHVHNDRVRPAEALLADSACVRLLPGVVTDVNFESCDRIVAFVTIDARERTFVGVYTAQVVNELAVVMELLAALTAQVKPVAYVTPRVNLHARRGRESFTADVARIPAAARRYVSEQLNRRAEPSFARFAAVRRGVVLVRASVQA